MSSRRPIRPRDIEDPSRIDSNLRNDYIEGNLDDYGVLYRVLVVETDLEGGNLDRDEEEPLNPPNSFRGRVLTRSRDKFTEKEDLPIFWPLFSHDVMPIKEGEHVYALFEDNEEKSHGLWIARIPEPFQLDNVNYIDGSKKFEEDPDNDISSVGKDQAVQDTDEKPEAIEVPEELTVEDVPAFTARVGDRVVQGSNNTTIVLGRDRPSDVDSGEKEGAGTIDIVAGRDGAEDMNMADDASRIYISMNSDVDANFEIEAGEGAGPSAAIAVKSDEIRLIARNGMKIVVGDGEPFSFVVEADGKVTVEAASDVFVKSDTKAVIEAPTVNLGGDNATENVILGLTFLTQLQTMLTAMSTELGGAGTFLTIPGVAHPASVAAISTFLAAIETFKSQIVKTK